MKKLLLPLILAVAFLTPCWLQAEAVPLKSPSDFSVEMVTHAGGQDIATKMYKDKDKTRMETSMPGMDSISIVRQDLKKMYTLMPGQKMYMEMELNPAMVAADVTAPKGEVKWEKLGSETVNGTACDKYKLTSTLEGKTTEMFYFLDSKGYPVRTEMTMAGQTMSVDYKNWKEGSQEASLFEIPAGYNKMQMPAMGGG